MSQTLFNLLQMRDIGIEPILTDLESAVLPIKLTPRILIDGFEPSTFVL